MTHIGIIGYGFVGKALAHGFSSENYSVKYFDKFLDSHTIEEVAADSEFIFICLPTPYKDDRIDLSIINENIDQLTKYTNNTDKFIIIKSTVIPGTTSGYAKKYPNTHFAFNPEFLTEANYLEDFSNPDRTVIGADDESTLARIRKLYKERFPEAPLFLTNTRAAEMSKYMANTLLMTKVLFANEMYDMCQHLGIDYDDVKRMVLADKRIGKSHLDVTSERGFGGKCFPKDLIAIMGLYEEAGIDHALLRSVWEKNLKIREKKDWEDIPFVKS